MVCGNVAFALNVLHLPKLGPGSVGLDRSDGGAERMMIMLVVLTDAEFVRERLRDRWDADGNARGHWHKGHG